MKRIVLLFAFALIFAAYGARADHYADVYVIPVASHVNGAFGSTWISDLAIHNFQTAPLTVELVLIESGASTLDNVVPLSTVTPVVIPAGGTRIVRDILAGATRPSSSTGAVIVGGDRPFAVTSRSYNVVDGVDTVGTSVLASRDFLTQGLGDAAAGATAYLPGLISNARYRTNVGFAAGAGVAGPLAFDIIVTGSEGATLGTRRVVVPAGTYMHQQWSIREIATAGFDAASARMVIVDGDGAIVPYATVVNNATNDAVFVTGNFPATTPFTASSYVPSVFEQLLLRFRADR